MGQNPTEEEIFQMISQVDDDNSGEIEFAEFMKVIENQKASAAKASDETDTIEAFVALGGNADKTGEISTEKAEGRGEGARAITRRRERRVSHPRARKRILFIRRSLRRRLSPAGFRAHHRHRQVDSGDGRGRVRAGGLPRVQGHDGVKGDGVAARQRSARMLYFSRKIRLPY
jgi:hypothetical protein